MRKSDGDRVDHEKKSDEVRVDHEKRPMGRQLTLKTRGLG